MDMNYLSPYIRVAMDSRVQPARRLDERVIFDYELIFLKTGELLLEIEGECFHCAPGDIIFLQPKVTHSAKILGNQQIRQPHIHFDLFYQPDSPELKVSFRPLNRIRRNEMEQFRPKLSIPGIGPPPTLLRLSNPEIFERKLFNVFDEWNAGLPYSDMRTKGLFIDLWTYYLREIYLQQNEVIPSNMATLKKVREYLDAHLEQDVTLEQLAACFHFSKYHISHLFKKTYGISPIRYHQTARINKAKELVLLADMTISDIACQMGYANASAFSRAFKALENVSPSFYR